MSRLALDTLRQLAKAGGVTSVGTSPKVRPADDMPTILSIRQLDRLAKDELVEYSPEQTSATMTSKGKAHLFEQVDHRELLQDWIGSLESQQRVFEQMSAQLRSQIQHNRAMHRLLFSLLSTSSTVDQEPIDQIALTHLVELEAGNRTAEPTLAGWYQSLLQMVEGLSQGQFHDSVRRLHQEQKIRLSPWTGPLWELPEPELALLIGHEVLFYVRSQNLGQHDQSL